MIAGKAWTRWVKTQAIVSGVPLTVHTRPHTNKYHAQAVRVDGILFHSQREAARYQELKLLARAGLITDLEIHPGWPLIITEEGGPPFVFHTVGMYHADFRYKDLRAVTWVVEDVKSQPTTTAAYKLRKRIVEARYRIQIQEIA